MRWDGMGCDVDAVADADADVDARQPNHKMASIIAIYGSSH